MRTAIIVPCLNEELTVARIVSDCRKHLPGAEIYVLDNGSTDQTATVAAKAGAHVVHSPQRGKGNVLRHAFRIIEADFYIMIDGDGTYSPAEGHRLLEIAKSHNYEMVMGSRLEQGERTAFRRFHLFGNRFFTSLVQLLFGFPVRDLLTGLRVFSLRFVRETNLMSQGFEIETELTIRAMAQNLAFCEVPISYRDRPQGSKSKLRTFRDGFKILLMVIRLWKDFCPLKFFTLLTAVCFAGSFAPVMGSFMSTCAALFFAMGFYFNSLLSLQRMRPRKSEPTKKDSASQKVA